MWFDRRFHVMIFCNNDEKFKDVLRGFQYEKLLKHRKFKYEEEYEYDFFIIQRFKNMSLNHVKGHRCDLVIVDRDLLYKLGGQKEILEFIEEIECGALNVQRFNIRIQYI